MSRPLRVEYVGAMYHVTCRGIERRELFRNDTDRRHYIQLLQEGALYFQVDIISYVLMNNHFHILLRTRQANLGRFMQWTSVAYTQYFNKKYKRVGPLLQGRYKAIVVGSADYYITLSRYIHLNPVNTTQLRGKSIKARTRMMEGYPWSSYQGIMHPEKRYEHFKVEEVLTHTGGDTPQGRYAYKKKMMDGMKGKCENPFEQVRFQLLLGTEEFIGWVKAKFIKGKNLKPHPMLKGIIEIKSTPEIAEVVARYYGVSAKAILQRNSRFFEARNVLVELTCRLNRQSKTMTEIGKDLAISGSAVAQVRKRIVKRINEDKDFATQVGKLAEACQ